MRLIVVRHGTAKSKKAWKGRDADRPLTAGGIEQARAVAAALGRYGPAQIVSSPSLRCIETVAPLASARGLKVERRKALGTDGGDAALRVVRNVVRGAQPSSTIVLCTHREVIVEVIPGLASHFGVSLGHRPPGAKGSCWTLVFRGERLVEIKYWRP